MNITTILKEHSNSAIATVSGYDADVIHMLRKNQVDEFAIKTGKNGKCIPTKGVLEKRIVEAYEQLKEKRKKF